MFLLIGGDSRVGLALMDFWTANKYEFHATTRRYVNVSRRNLFFDLTRPGDLQLAPYESALLCAGVSSIRKCEEDPESTKNINVVSTKKLIEAVIANNCYFLFLSTTKVFDGRTSFPTVSDQTNPRTEYGRQKREIEEFLKVQKNCGVLRLTKIQDEQNDLLQAWKKQIEQGQSIEAFHNVYFSPIKMERVVERITDMMITKSRGITHLGGREEISYYEYACRQVVRWGYSGHLVVPVSCPVGDRRFPRHSSLK